MSVTYPHDRALPHETHAEAVREEPYVPVYARTRGSTRGRKGGVKTWMILAPLGVLVLGGATAALVMGERSEAPAAPLAEPAATGPVFPAQPVISEAPPLDAPAATIEAVPEPVVRAAPAPERRAAPAPVRRAAPAPAPATREAPAEPAAPQPYTSSLNTTPPAAPATTPAPTPAAPPVIVIQPAG